MMSQPAAQPRVAARAAGLKFYFGQPCPRGHRRRYVSTHACVTCLAAYHATRERVRVRPSQAKPRPPEVIATTLDEARRLGTVKYHGRPHRCGSTVRYVSNAKCVACLKALNVNNARLKRLRSA